jgi:hypothetical protein
MGVETSKNLSRDCLEPTYVSLVDSVTGSGVDSAAGKNQLTGLTAKVDEILVTFKCADATDENYLSTEALKFVAGYVSARCVAAD